MARMNVQEYAKYANNQGGGLIRLTCIKDDFGSPIKISIRFRAQEYNLEKINWNDFVEDAEEESRLYAFISSDEKMFHAGIIEIELKLIIYRKESEDAAEIINYICKTLNQHKKIQINRLQF